MVKQTQDTFAHDAGIDIGEERGGVFDEFHRIAQERMAKAIEDSNALFAEYKAELKKANHRKSLWVLVALLGWGLFAIAFLSRILS